LIGKLQLSEEDESTTRIIAEHKALKEPRIAGVKTNKDIPFYEAEKIKPREKNIVLEKNRNNAIFPKDTLDSESQDITNRQMGPGEQVTGGSRER